MNKEFFLNGTEPVATLAGWGGMPVLDAGLTTRCAWASGKTLVEQLMEERGEVVYGEMTVAGYKMGTLDLFMDEPAKLALPAVTARPEGEVHTYAQADMAVGLFSKLPAAGEKTAGFLLASSCTGPLAAVYRSYLSAVQLVHGVLGAGFTEDTLLTGWCTAVLPPLCDDDVLFRQRCVACSELGSVTSFWVRAEGDESVQQCLQALPLHGEVRLHNVKTANTFIKGRVEEEDLAKALGLL